MRLRVAGCGLRVRASVCLAGLAFVLGGCSTAPVRSVAVDKSAVNPKPETRNTKQPPQGGGYYLDDGPGDNPPPNLEAIPDAEPKPEPLHKFANNPYSVFGQEYVPDTSIKPYKAQGLASWYGRRFHGKRTSSGEPYDMYAMTAAHPTLPIPSYAKVTNLRNSKSVVVRINDRGPFHSNRLIDLSYTAAYKLGITQGGSGRVEVEAIDPLQFLAQAGKPASTVALQTETIAETRLPSSPAAAATVSATPSSGIYLQLGAFSQQQNAESFHLRVKQQLGDLAEALQIFAKDGRFRVHLGPYQSESEVARVAALVKQSLNIAPMRTVH